MSISSFFTPINYLNSSRAGFQAIHNFVENYFSFGGRVVVIHSNGVTASSGCYTPSYIEIAVKILGFPVFSIPCFVGKLCFRIFSNTIVWSEDSKLGGLPLLPNENRMLKNRIEEIFREKVGKLFWLPHPKFTEKHLEKFPDQEVQFFWIMEVKEQMACLGQERLIAIIQHNNDLGRHIGGNDFFRWLNEKSLTIENPYEQFMSCSDFVFMALHQAGLVSKEVIKSLYRKEIEIQIQEGEVDSFYGFKLNLFKDFSPTHGAEGEVPKPGDILIAFDKGKPCHMMFLSGKTPLLGHWKGIGLWNMGSAKGTVSDIELYKLQEECKRNKQTLTFKYCSLDAALALIKS